MNVRRALWLGVAAFGVAIAVDGALRGAERHRVAAVSLGVLIALPALVRAAVGRRGIGRAVSAVAHLALALGVALVLAEVLVRALGMPAFAPAELREDPELGHAHAPLLGGRDGWGFRNRQVPSGAVDLVLIGDEQVLGLGLARSAALPERFASRTGRSVYSLGEEGYGPLQYVALTERALQLEPERVVVVVHLGDDLHDAFRFGALERWSEFRAPGLDVPPLDPLVEEPAPSLNLGMGILDALMRNAWVLRTAGERFKLAVRHRFDAAPASADAWPFRGDIAAALSPGPRTLRVDLERPEIAHGAAVLRATLARISELSSGRGTSVHVLLLRSKESYYALLAERRDGARSERAAELAALVRTERPAVDAVLAAARDAGLSVTDPALAIVEAMEAGQVLFPRGEGSLLGPNGVELVASQLALDLGLQPGTPRDG